MKQWLRKIRVTFQGDIDGFVVNPGPVTDRELKVEFDVVKTISGSPNTYDLKIWNLAPKHRNSVGKELDKVTIEAGYTPDSENGNVGIIAQGRLRDVYHQRDGADIVTYLSCGDGDRAYRLAKLSKTFKAGTNVQQVVEELYSELSKYEISRGEWLFPETIKTFNKSYSISGSVIRQLDKLGRSNKFYWSMQNETMEIIPSNKFLPGIVPISANDGMIGTPAITDNGIRVSCLLNPEVRPNRMVKVTSEILTLNSQNNIYRVSEVNFSGNNIEGNFICDIEGETINNGLVDEGVI